LKAKLSTLQPFKGLAALILGTGGLNNNQSLFLLAGGGLLLFTPLLKA